MTNTSHGAVSIVATAMREKRRELIALPLSRIWDDLAKVAVGAIAEGTAAAPNPLSAAAPEMFDALDGLVNNGFSNEELATRWQWPVERIAAARAAFAKARGEG